MFKKAILAASASLTAFTALPAAAEAAPQRYGYSDGYYAQSYRGDRYDRRYNQRRYDQRRYDNRRYDNRYYGQRRCSGSTGTIIGALAGGLLGHEVAEGRRGRGDGTAGAIIGGAVGALAGRAIDKGDCRR